MAGCKWAPEGGEIGLLSLGSPVMTLASDIQRPELIASENVGSRSNWVGLCRVELLALSSYVMVPNCSKIFNNENLSKRSFVGLSSRTVTSLGGSGRQLFFDRSGVHLG